MVKKENSKLEITLKDYIDLLNKYNANMEFYNWKIRVLLNNYNVVSNLLSIICVVCVVLAVWLTVLYCS